MSSTSNRRGEDNENDPPPDITASAAAAGLVRKSPSDHMHSVDEVAGLMKQMEEMAGIDRITEALDNDVVEIEIVWEADLSTIASTPTSGSTANRYLVPMSSVSAARKVPWLTVGDDGAVELKGPGYYTIGNTQVSEVFGEATFERPTFANSDYVYRGPNDGRGSLVDGVVVFPEPDPKESSSVSEKTLGFESYTVRSGGTKESVGYSYSVDSSSSGRLGLTAISLPTYRCVRKILIKKHH